MALDAYRTLGLEPGASAAEVKRAYRRLAKANHPDSAGPAALPRFLAIHEAYEVLTTGRVTGRGPGVGGRGGPTAQASSAGAGATAGPEPWRADPARARAAREQARARGRASGAGAGAGTAAGAATGATGRSSAGPGAGATTGSTRAGSGASASTGATGTRRRASRKATLGSTSYDEARDPSDTTWAGASWYGPTSGEYWRVNPREYADPRKHGPEYQSRARRQTPTGTGWEHGPETDGAPEPEPEFDPAAGAREDFAGGAASAGSAPRADRTRSAPPEADRAWATPPRPGDAGRLAADDDEVGGLAALARLLENEPRDPIRRLGYALLAWAPIGLAAASVIGTSTGCAVYRADCSGIAPLLPWLAQAIILGLLMLLPRLARILSVGTLTVVLALVPGALFILAFGGSGQPEAPAVLEAILALVWLVGIGLGLVGTGRLRQRAGSS